MIPKLPAKLTESLNRRVGQQKRRTREACDKIILDTCYALDELAMMYRWDRNMAVRRNNNKV